MNTPPQIKRYKFNSDMIAVPPSGGAVHGLENDTYGAALAKVAVGFSHLEGVMAFVLAVLLGYSDTEVDTCGFVLRSIISARARYQMMKALLELSPKNVHLSPQYDEILAEFSAINSRRNAFVHGLWYTDQQNQDVYLSESDEQGWGFLASKPIQVTELTDLYDRMLRLQGMIWKVTIPDLQSKRATPAASPLHVAPTP